MLNEIKTDEKIDMNKAETQLDEKYVQSLIRKTFDEHLGLDQDGDFCGYNLNGGKGSLIKSDDRTKHRTSLTVKSVS